MMSEKLPLRAELFRRLQEFQITDGSFVGTRWRNGVVEDDHARLPIVCTAWIALWLKNAGVEDAASAAMDFLRRTRMDDGAWPFYDGGEAADLDTTMVALRLVASEGLAGEQLAAIATLLTTHEIQEGGPYRTSLDDEDVDPAVNANIALFLRGQEVELENVGAFLERVKQEKLPSSRYRSGAFLHVLLASFQRADTQEALKEFVTLSEEGARPFIRVFKGEDEVCYGSPALSAAFALAHAPHVESVTEESQRSTMHIDLAAKVDVHWEQRISTLPIDARESTMALFRMMRDKDTDHAIAGLPKIFANAFALGDSSEKWLTTLGAATLGGWMAYTVYDNILDDEADPLQLSAANIAFREMNRLFEEIAAEVPGFGERFHAIMDRVDAANQWEVTNCRATIRDEKIIIDRLPSYSDLRFLAERSLGHALSAIALALMKSNVTPTEINTVERWFIGYLSARQLNDDAHDWEEDLRHGHLNSVGLRLLRTWRERQGLSPDETFEFSLSQLDELRELFWNDVVPSVAEDTLRLAAIAREAVAHPPFAHLEMIEPLMRSVERPAEKAIRDQREARGFIRGFSEGR